MIKQIILRDERIEEISKQLSLEASGKILTISVKLEQGITCSIATSLNEEVLDVKEDGIYYPRANISSRKELNNELSGEVQESDYYYFKDLLIELESESEMDGIALKELIILYDDME